MTREIHYETPSWRIKVSLAIILETYREMGTIGSQLQALNPLCEWLSNQEEDATRLCLSCLPCIWTGSEFDCKIEQNTLGVTQNLGFGANINIYFIFTVTPEALSFEPFIPLVAMWGTASTDCRSLRACALTIWPKAHDWLEYNGRTAHCHTLRDKIALWLAGNFSRVLPIPKIKTEYVCKIKPKLHWPPAS